MGRDATGQKKGAADMSVADVFRIYREVKDIQAQAGITRPDPTDKDAIRRGLLGDGYDKSLERIGDARKVHPPR